MAEKIDYRTEKQKKAIKYIRNGIIVIVLIVLLILLLRSIRNMTATSDETDETEAGLSYISVNDFDSLAELLEAYNCKYISDENTYDLITIYVEFDKDLYTGNTSNENYFTNIIYATTQYENYKDIEFIDEKLNIDIEVTCQDQAIVQIKINGDVNYYLNQETERNLSKEKTKTTRMNIVSTELQDLIDNDWNPTNVNLGTKESSANKYDIYFDEGYKIKVVGQNVFNIVFTTKYEDGIVSNLNASSSKEEVLSVFGDPTFNDYEELYGYLGEKIYVFFDFINNQVSVYPIVTISSTDENELIDLIETMNETGDVKQFAMDLTSLWTDYDIYDYDSNYVSLQYTLRGIKLEIYSSSLKNGIFIYKNYSRSYDILDLDNVYFNGDDLVANIEEQRYINECEKDYYASVQENAESNYYKIEFVENGSKNYISFVSKDLNKYFDSEIEADANSFAWVSDSEIVYGVEDEGIFYYDIINDKKKQLIKGTDEKFEINSYKNGILKYDTKEVKIEF